MRILKGADPSRLLASMPERFSHVVRAWADQAPAQLALVCDAKTFSYGELWTLASEMVSLLRELGVRPGDRVMIVGENGLQIVALLLATSELDVWAVPLNARMSEREVTIIRSFADCRIAIYAIGDSAAAAKHATAAGAGERESAIGRLAMSSVNSAAEPEPVFPDKARQTAVLVFTSGTTGEPKGVMVSHQALIYMGANMAELRGFTREDVLYNSSPVSHTIGLGTVLMTAFWSGACAEMVARFTAAHAVRAVNEERITCITGVPTLFARILEYLAANNVALQSRRLRIIATAGAPLDLALKTRLEAAFHLRLGNSYGMTECNPIARSTAGVEEDEVGELQPGVEMRLVWEDGSDAPTEEAAEIWVRGPMRMLGYFRNDAADAAALREGGWVATGDIGTMDRGGKFRVVGRRKELIIHSGFNVYPSEVESVLGDYPGIAMAAVIGRPVSGNEEVIAYVQPMPGKTISPRDIGLWIRERLAPYKIPAHIIVMPELPIGPTGKVMKIRLKELEAQEAVI